MRVLLFFLVSLIVYSSYSSVLAADENTLLSVRDDPYRFSASENEARARVLLIPGDNAKKAGSIALAVVEVGHDGVTLAAPKDAITIPGSVDPDEDGLYFIEPVLDPSAIAGKLYGSYVVTLLASASIPAAKPEDPPTELSETFDLTITYPKIELEAPLELLIEQTCLFGRDCETVATPLNLEAKGSIGPSGLRVVQARNAQHGDKRVPGTIEVKQPGGRSELQKLPVNIAVDFPKGDSTGTLRISSPEIERMNVNFKVQRRDGLVALGIVVLVGLVAGFLLRTNLEKGLQRRRREITLKTLQQRIIESGVGIGDQDLQKSLDGIASKVKDRINDRTDITDAALKTDITAWETELKTALDKSAADAGKTETALETLSDLVRANWTTPVSTQDVLKSSLSDVDVIRQQIRDREFDEAAKQLKTVQIALHQSLASSTKKWRVTVGNTIAALGQSLPEPLPDGTKPDFEPIGSALAAAVDPVEAEAGADPNESAKTILKAGHVALNASNRLLYKLRRDLDAAAVGVSRILDGRLESGPATALETAREHLATMKPESWTEQPDGGQTDLKQVVADLTEAMTLAVRSVEEPVSSETAGHLKVGKYSEAATAAVTQPVVTGERLGHEPRVAGISGATAELDSITAGMYFGSSHANWVDTREPALRLAHAASHRAAMIERLKLDRIETIGQIVRREWLQTGVAWVGLMFVALFIFGDTFVGTYQDYIKVFLWGFTTDAGVGTLLERAKAKVQ